MELRGDESGEILNQRAHALARCLTVLSSDCLCLPKHCGIGAKSTGIIDTLHVTYDIWCLPIPYNG